MNVNRYGSTAQTSHPLAFMQPPPGMAAALVRTAPRIHSTDETPCAPIGHAADWLSHGGAAGLAPRAGGAVPPFGRNGGKAVPDRLDDSGKRTVEGKDSKGDPVRDTWNKDGRRIRDSVAADGTRIHETWAADGKHIRDSVAADGTRVRERWDPNGRHVRDMWAANGTHIRDTWDPHGKHKRIIWHEMANHAPPSVAGDGLTPAPTGHNRRRMHRPVAGDAPAPSPLPGVGAGSGEPSEPVRGGDGGETPEPTGGDGGQTVAPAGSGNQPTAPISSGGQPSAPVSGGDQLPAPADGDAFPSAPTGGYGQPSAPTGNDSGDIQAPDSNTGYTDYDQPAPGAAQPPSLIGFTPEQGGIVTRAYQHVKRMIDGALDKLESGHPDASFTHWFGSPTQQNMQKVEQVFTHMQHAMSHDRFTFVLGAPHDDSELAHVQSSSPHQIDLKPHFFDHAFGANTPEATIAHELSHFPYIGNTEDHLYGPAAVASLAARNSDVATDNAENYGMFVRDQATA